MLHFVISHMGSAGKANHVYYKRLADELVGRGHRVTFLGVGHPETDANPAFLSWPSGTATKWGDALFLYRFVRRHRPDCLISQFSTENVSTLVGALTGVPTRVVWYRTLYHQIQADATGPDWLERVKTLRKRLVYLFATDLVANSQASVEDVQTFFRVPAAKVSMLHNLVPPPRTEPVSKLPNRLVSVGRFTPSKNQQVLVEALPLIREQVPGVHVDFYGEGVCEDACRARAAELGVAELCTFHGYKPLRDVMAGLARASVCVMTSKREAFGYVAAEAQAVGTPVVASRVDGIPEVVLEGKTGFLVHPEDAAAFAEKISTLLQNDALRERFGDSAREHFCATFSTDKISQHANHLERLAGKKRRGRAKSEHPDAGAQVNTSPALHLTEPRKSRADTL